MSNEQIKHIDGGFNPTLINADEWSVILDYLRRKELLYKACPHTLSPFVMCLHNQPGEPKESFLLLFLVPTNEGSAKYSYTFVRQERLSQNEFIDWFAATDGLLSTENILLCN